MALMTATSSPASVWWTSHPRPGAVSAQHRTTAVEVVVDLSLVPDVVAAGDDVDAAPEQLLGQARGQAGTRRDVLTVGDDHVQRHLVTELWQRVHHGQPSGLADDVADDADADLPARAAHRA
jgi:hypothetical protein